MNGCAAAIGVEGLIVNRPFWWSKSTGDAVEAQFLDHEARIQREQQGRRSRIIWGQQSGFDVDVQAASGVD